MGKVDKWIVSVNADGVYSQITWRLSVEVFKPKGTLKLADKYKTKIDLGSEVITELRDEGLNIELVLADSLDCESSEFIRELAEYNECLCWSNFVVIIESGCHLTRGLRLMSGVNLREDLVIKNQKPDRLAK